MAILNEFGQPYRHTQKLAHAADRNTSRGPQYSNVLDDISLLIPQHDRMTLQSLSRRLYVNFPVYKGAIDQKADWVIGSAWNPVFLSPDTEAAKLATEWVMDRFYPICDVRGGTHNWLQTLNLLCQSLDREGEDYILLSESNKGDPRIQHLPAHRVGQRRMGEKEVKPGPEKGSGKYSGLPICDGVVTNKYGRPVAYLVLGNKSDGSNDEFISARDLIQCFDPDFQEQMRGLPMATGSISDMVHMLTSKDFELIAQSMISSLGLIEYNETGMADEDPAVALTAGSTAADGLTSELYAGGTTRYFKANSGAKLESVTHQRPGDLWDRFQDRLTRSLLVNLKLPYSVWKGGTQGTSVREDVGRARRTVEQRQTVIKKIAQRVVSYAVGRAIDRGEIPAFSRFWDVDFTLPPRLTVDDGRENVALLKQLEEGALTMAEYQGYKGRTEEQHYREKWRGAALDQQIKSEIESSTGQTLGGDEEAATAEGASATDELKGRFDAYGVGVRAGAITPQVEDEDAFRTEAGLPAPGPHTKSLWSEQGNTRQPITLVQEGTEAQPMQGNNQSDDDDTEESDEGDA